MRVTLGLMLLGSWVLLWPELPHLLEIIDPQVLRTDHTSWRVSYFDHVPAEWLGLSHVAGTLVIVAFTVGFQARLANLLVLVMLVSFWHRLPWSQNGGDRVLRLWTLYLLTVPSGAAVSVDAWIRQRRGKPAVTEVSGVAHRLVQLQLCWMYFLTGYDKLLQSDQWRVGDAIYYSMNEGTFSRAPWLYDPIVQSDVGVAVLMGLTWLTLGWELAFPVLVAFRRTRLPLGLLPGVALHLGIFATMSVGMFGPASIWGYQAFLSDRWSRGAPDGPS